jgi:hypothetical protein
MIVEFNGQVIPKHKWTPFIHRTVRRMKRLERSRRRRIYATGTTIMLMGSTGFAPILRIKTAGSGTDTVPSGAQNVILEAWGSGGGGSAGTGSGCSAAPGGGGSSGSYSRTSIACLTQNGNTLNYTVATGGPAGSNGSSSSISGGTFSGLTTMNAGRGSAGNFGSGATSSPSNGGTQANTTGTAVGVGQSLGGAGLSGTVAGDGSPYARGGNGGVLGAGHAGSPGSDGAAVFFYT